MKIYRKNLQKSVKTIILMMDYKLILILMMSITLVSTKILFELNGHIKKIEKINNFVKRTKEEQKPSTVITTTNSILTTIPINSKNNNIINSIKDHCINYHLKIN